MKANFIRALIGTSESPHHPAVWTHSTVSSWIALHDRFLQKLIRLPFRRGAHTALWAINWGDFLVWSDAYWTNSIGKSFYPAWKLHFLFWSVAYLVWRHYCAIFYQVLGPGWSAVVSNFRWTKRKDRRNRSMNRLFLSHLQKITQNQNSANTRNFLTNYSSGRMQLSNAPSPAHSTRSSYDATPYFVWYDHPSNSVEQNEPNQTFFFCRSFKIFLKASE